MKITIYGLVLFILFYAAASLDKDNGNQSASDSTKSMSNNNLIRPIRSPLFDTFYGNVATVGNTDDNNQGIQLGQLGQQTAVTQGTNQNSNVNQNQAQNQNSSNNPNTSQNMNTSPGPNQAGVSCVQNGTPCNYLGIGGFTKCCSGFCLQREGESQGKCADH